jgi:hypothetical protein
MNLNFRFLQAVILPCTLLFFNSCQTDKEEKRIEMLKDIMAETKIDSSSTWKFTTSGIQDIDIKNGRHNTLSLKVSIDSVFYVPLETNDNCLIGKIDNIYQDEKNIIIADNRFAKEVFVFDRKGKFLSKISDLGDGPKQYKSITATAVNFESHEIRILDRISNKILTFDFHGNLIKADPLPLLFTEMAFTGRGSEMILSNSGELNSHIKEIESYNLIKIANNKVLGKSFPFDRNKSGAGYSFQNVKNLAFSDKKIYYSPKLSDFIYQVSSDSISAKFHLNFNGKGFTKKDRENLNDITYKKRMNENEFFMFNGDFAVNSEYVYLKILNKQAFFACLYNKKHRLSMSFADIMADHDRVVLFNFPYTGYKNFFVSPLLATQIFKTRTDLKKFKKSAEIVSLYNKVKADDNPVLMFYSFKQNPKL